MELSALVLALLLKHCPPGGTAFSVEPAPSGVFSSFYGTTVARESFDSGRARYSTIATELAAAAADVLADEKPRGSQLWRARDLVLVSAAVAIFESGLREDVEVGRGTYRVADDVGGRGRGPSGELCFMQIHPRVFSMFAPGGERSLLGAEPAAVRECFRAGMRMLIRARAFCSLTDPGHKRPGFDWLWSTVAMYGTGNSCLSSNHGKTVLRVKLARKMMASVRGAA